MMAGLLGSLLGYFNGGQSPYDTDVQGQITSPGLLGTFGRGLQNNSDALMQFGMGMMSGSNGYDNWANAARGLAYGSAADNQRAIRMKNELEAAARKKAYADYIAKNPDMAGASDIFQNDPELAQAVIKNRMTRDPLDDEEKRARIAELNARAQGKNATFGLNPIYGQRKMPDGSTKTVLLQPGNNGEIRESALPDGVEITSGVDKVDGGTQWYLYDKRTGQLVGTQPKDVQGEAAQKAAGTAAGDAQGQAAAGLSKSEDAANTALSQIQELRSSPDKSRGTGMSSVFNGIPGTRGRDFQARVDQLKGGAFLQAYQSLRGTGAISEIEGKKAENAITRMDTSLSEEEFNKALDEFESIIKIGVQRQRNMAGGNTTQPTTPGPAQGAPPASGSNRIRYDANGNRL